MKKILLLLSIPLFLLLPACEKGFEELNKNPFFPTQADVGAVFNTVVDLTRLGWNEQFYIHNEMLYGITQLAALTDASFQNSSIGTEEVWEMYYKSLAHIRTVENRLNALEVEEEALDNVRSMLKILTAYKTFRVTDLFGDMPFFDAGKGFEGLQYARPKFDTQEEIYKSLLQDLQWANEHLNTLPNPQTASGQAYISLGDFDNLFFGDMLRWKKFANSLRLRHALRMVEKDPAFAQPILAEIIEGNLPIIEEGEDVMMSPERQNWLNESLNWSFREHKKLRMGSNIWQSFSTSNATDGSGIYDPRAYIFFEPNNANEWAAYPQIPNSDTAPSGGIPYQQHRDNNYTVKGTANIYSPFNYYLIRDEKQVPQLILTAAEVHFIKAEVYARGLGVAANDGEADASYTLGVVASINMWQNLVNGTQIWENKRPTLSSGQIFGVVNHPNISIFGNDNKLKLIYQQRWLDAFRQPWEAYSLMRRTRMTPHEGEFSEHFRFAYPPSEAQNNPENWANQVAKMGADSEKVKVWWNE
ncbi:MAG: SusD/RagB family nutrient-binding outer membrane lipoprotein [Chitinophagales bacterium]